MGFLHKLWDETLAGPAPESGLSKLRKFNSFSGAASHQRSSSSNHHMNHDDDDHHHHFPVSRSITILRTNSNSAAALPNINVSTESGSVPSSPSSSATPVSPFSPTTPRGDFKKLTRRKSTTSEALQRKEPRSPTGYDWIVLSALDR